MAFCLPPKQAEKFKQAIIDGTIDPGKLAEMDSAERHAFFSKHLGDDVAAPVNSLFESKLLLKNQQEGMINWAKKVMGTNPTAQRDIISRIGRMDKVLAPEEEGAFLEDLAAQKLGTHVTYEEAKNITDLANKVSGTKTAMESGGDRMAYGRAVVGLRNYVGELTTRANKFSLEELKKNPIQSIGKGISEVAGNAKAIKASMDNSAIFRQGWKTLWTHPGIWQDNARQSFVNLVKSFGKDQVMNELNADILSRPTIDLMRRAKLDVGVTEESYPTTLPEKIPVLGKFYKASENAFSAFVRKTRADVFDKYIDIARKSDVDLDDAQLQSIGKMVNSLTGRGHLGALEPSAGAINNLFFSPRMLKAHVDTLLQPVTGAGDSNFVRKQAAINLVKIMAGTAAVMALAKAVKKDSVELDPRSADFGKIRVGDTRFDVSGGMASMAVLAARLASMSSKSSTTGKVTDLNSGQYGGQTGTDVVYNFFENKLSPAASVAKDVIKGQTLDGSRPTLGNEAVNLFVPLPVTTYLELKNEPNAAPALAATIADGLGISVNTYSGTRLGGDLNISNPTLVRELKQQRVSIANPVRLQGEPSDAYRMRAKITGKIIEGSIRDLVKDDGYKSLSAEEKKKALDDTIRDTRTDITKTINKNDYKNLSTKERLDLLRELQAQTGQ